ncbi:MAG: DNA polymerase IV [Candidatus Binatia bacterium]
MRWYLHLDMDAFFASVEQAVSPELKGKPVIVGGKSGRGVVTSASYEARKYGVHSAMPGFQARRLCPLGIFLPNRHRLYSQYSETVFAILRQYSPVVRTISIDEGIVDLTGTEKLLGPPLKTAERIIQQIKTELGLPASGGLSTSCVVAKIAATVAKPHGLIHVLEGSEEDFLSPLSVALVPGVGPKAEKELLRRGIKTIGDLLQRPELKKRFFDFDGGNDRHRTRDHSIGNETTLDKPLTRTEEMEKVLWKLVEEVGTRLRRERLFARCLTVKIRYSDFKTITRSRTLKIPTCFDRQIFEVADDLLNKNLSPARPVRLLGVSASALLSAGWQESLFDVDGRRSWEKLYRGIDRLRDKYGDSAIGAATPRNKTR